MLSFCYAASSAEKGSLTEYKWYLLLPPLVSQAGEFVAQHPRQLKLVGCLSAMIAGKP